MSDNIDIVVTEKGTQEVIRSLSKLSKSSDSASVSITVLQKALRSLGSSKSISSSLNSLASITDKIARQMASLSTTSGKLSTSLNATATSAIKLQAATSTLTAANIKAALADQRLALSTQKVATEAAKTQLIQQRLATEVQRTAAAQQTVAAATTRAGTALSQQAVAAANATTAQNRAAASALKLAQAQTTVATGNTVVAAATSNTTKNVQKLNGAATANRMHLVNISYQLQDIFVGLTSGQRPMTVFIQQGAQLYGIAQMMNVSLVALAKTIGTMVLRFVAFNPLMWAFAAAAGAAYFSWKTFSDGLSKEAGISDYVKSLELTNKELKKLQDQHVTVGDAVKGTWESIKQFAKGIYDAVDAQVALTEKLKSIWRPISALLQALWNNQVSAYMKANDTLIGLIIGTFNAVTKTWKQLPAAIADGLIQGINNLISFFQKLSDYAIETANKIISTFNIIRKAAGIDPIELFQTAKLPTVVNAYSGAADSISSVWSTSMEEALRSSEGWTSRQISNLRKNIENATKARLKSSADLIKADRSERASSASKIPVGQTLLEQAIRQNELNRETLSINSAMTAARRELTSSEKLAVNINILLASGNEKLTASMRSRLTAARDLMLASGEQVRQQELEMNGLQALARQQNEFAAARESLNQQSNIELASVSMGDEAIVELQKRQEQYDIYFSNVKRINDNIANYGAEAAKKLTEAEKVELNNRLEQVRQNTEVLRKLQSDYSNGWKSASANYLETARNFAQQMKDLVTNSLSSAEGALVRFVETGKLSFNDLANSLIKDLARIASQKILGGLLSIVTGGQSGLASFFGGSNAKGAAFTKTDKFAKGSTFTNSIVKKPTLFQYAKGSKFGEMGEAGPEAVMPLSRTRSGDLGVRIADSSVNSPVVVNSPNITVNSYNDGNTETEVETTTDALGNINIDIITTQIEKRLGSRLASGTGSIYKGTKSRFGLKDTV